MTIAQRLTFEQYLEMDNGTTQRFELVDGRLIELPPESEPNTSVANYLFLQLVNAGLSFRLVQPHICELQVPVLEAGDSANRFPDLVILREDHLELTRKRLTITFDALPPHLVVEVVSPGQSNRDRDYVRKRKQYAARGIPEYWLIDLDAQTMIVLHLENGSYGEVGRYNGKMLVESPKLMQLGIQLQLTVEQILDAVRD